MDALFCLSQGQRGFFVDDSLPEQHGICHRVSNFLFVCYKVNAQSTGLLTIVAYEKGDEFEICF